MPKRKRPFRFNPKIDARHARLCRLIQRGIIGDDPTKAKQRQAATIAATHHTITRIPTGQRARSKPFDATD